MQYKTGKPKRKRSNKPKPTLDNLTPLDRIHSGNVTMREACAYLKLSMPTVYGMVKRGELASVVVGGKRFVTPASIKLALEGKAQPTKRPTRFVPIRTVKRARAAKKGA